MVARVSNPEKRQDGLNGLIEEMLVLKPDIEEAMDNYDDIVRMFVRGLDEVQRGMNLSMQGYRTIRAAKELFDGQNRYNRDEARKRIAEIMRNAERADLYQYLALPTLRVVAGDPEGAA
jgi:hypothetical protein